MTQQISFTLEDLKGNPDYCVFAMALEERLKEGEARRRNLLFALLAMSVPVILSVGAGIYGLADTAMTTRIQGAKAEIVGSIPTTVSSEIRDIVNPTFEAALVAKISSRSLEQARNAYELAAALSQLNATATRIEAGEGFTESEAERAIDSLTTAVKKGSLSEPLTKQATLRAGAQLAQSFAAAERPDLLARVAAVVGAETALTSDEVALAATSALGQALVGRIEAPENWPKEMVALFEAAADELSAQPDLAREWELAIAYRRFQNGDLLGKEKIEALLADTEGMRNRGSAGRVVGNIALLTEPALYTRGGENNLDTDDHRVKSLMTEFFDRYRASLSATLQDAQAREGTRALMMTAYQIGGGASSKPLARFFARLCGLDPRLCSSQEASEISQIAEFLNNQ